MDELLNLWPDTFRWYMGTVIPFEVVLMIGLIVMTDHTFIWLYLIAALVVGILGVLTGAFGIGKALEEWWGCRKFNKQIEEYTSAVTTE